LSCLAAELEPHLRVVVADEVFGPMSGFTTIHSGSARQALSRLRFICQLADVGSQLTLPALSALVSDAIDVVVHCTRQGGVPRVSEVLAVEDLHVAAGGVAFTTTSLFARPRYHAPMVWSGNLPVRATRALKLAGYDVRSLLSRGGVP
jgi:pilus assembly protein CpaF